MTALEHMTRKLTRRLNDAYGFSRTSKGKHTTITLSIGECRELIYLIEAAEKRIAELQSSVIAPGIMRCAGCGFVLTKNNINMAAGTITAGDSNTESCPNGCGPLWPVTWKEQALQMRDSSEHWFEELQQSRQRIAELEANKGKPVMFIDGDISASDAEKLAAVIREWDDAPATVAPEEMEARTVTLPDVEKWRSVDAVRAQNAYKVLVSKVLADIGIAIEEA